MFLKKGLIGTDDDDDDDDDDDTENEYFNNITSYNKHTELYKQRDFICH